MKFVLTTAINVTHLAARTGILTCLVLAAMSIFDGYALGEQIASLLIYLVASCALALAWFGAHRDFRWVAVSSALIIFGCVRIWGYSTTPEAKHAEGSEECMRVLVTNAFIGNPDQTQLARLAKEVDADVVLTSEMSQMLHEALREDYPFAKGTDIHRLFGMGIYSRFPISDVQVLRHGHSQAPRMFATLTTSRGPVNIINVHPLPPSNPILFADRNTLIEDLAQSVRESQNPIIVAGDFNTTTWSRHLLPLREVASRADTGGTFPVSSPLRIPIDHVFYRGLRSPQTERYVDSFGTDHVPFVTTLCL